GLAALADIGSGLLALRRRLEAGSARYLVALASGIVLAAAFFELLPEAHLEVNGWVVGLGFFVFYLIEKAVMLHACGEAECNAHEHPAGWVPALGMASDNIVDGIGIAVATFTDVRLGLVLAVAVVAHEIPQGLSTVALLQGANVSRGRIVGALAFAGAMYPAGALLSAAVPPALYTSAIAFVAGSFIYVGAGDLLMEAHKRFNWKVLAATILGATFMYGVVRVLG
ncbi:MAG: ZIP family metal transporter, partial [Euryarchaeota archaeon]|nr:ZIP family metal transporter [Euryarchaeota archaeon]